MSRDLVSISDGKPFYAHPLDPPKLYSFARCLGRPVAMAWLSWEQGRNALARELGKVLKDMPWCKYPYGTLASLCWQMQDTATEILRQRGMAERRITRVVWPMCEQRLPGAEVLEAAERANGGILCADEVLTICRDVAVRTSPRRRRVRR